jgi:ATP-dependent helicase IRC3
MFSLRVLVIVVYSFHSGNVMRCPSSWWQGLRAYSTNASNFAPVVLRPYQEHCLDACAQALRSGASRIGVSLPTGSGKTTVFISLLSRISSPISNPTARRSLIIVNSIELARQSAMQVANLFPTWSVEIEQGHKHRASGNADV